MKKYNTLWRAIPGGSGEQIDLSSIGILDYENGRNPFEEKRRAITPWKRMASECVSEESEEILTFAEYVSEKGRMDALISYIGYVDAERFIALLSKEPFDYTKWRETHLDEGLNVRQLSKKAQEYSKIQV